MIKKDIKIHFLIKFLKSLNSAESSKALSLALASGVISGFLPSFNIINIIILLVVFSFRIPIGLYFASSTVFAIVGYFLDPIFHYTGLYLLQNPTLNSFWTSLYNTPFLRWSGFNNSIILGSFVWGIVLAPIFYIILNKLSNKYREKIFPILKKSKLTSWIVPEEIKKQGIFRISGLIGFAVIFGGIAFLIITFLDPLLKNSLQYSLSKVLKKPVMIENLNTSISKASLNITDIKVGDIKTDKIYLNLNLDYLVWKKFDIQNLIIKNIHTDKTLVSLINSNSNTTEKDNSNKSHNFTLPSIKVPKADKILAKQQLKTTIAIKKLKKDYQKSKQLIDKIKNLKNDNKVANLKTEIEEIKTLANKIKTPQDVQNILAKIDKIKKEINSIKTNVQKYKKELSQDLKAIKIASKEDYQNLSSKYDMLKNGKYTEFTESILTPKLAKYLKTADEIYTKIKPYLPQKEKTKETKYIRGKGMNVKFTDKIKYPSFVIEHTDISFKTSDSKWQLIAKNITNNQTLLNRHTTAKITGVSPYFTNLQANLDYYKIATINSTVLNLKTGIKIMPIVKKVTLNGTISGTLQKPIIKLKSNLDKILANYLKTRINKEINKQKAKLNSLLNKKLQNELKDINLKDLDLANMDLNNYNKTLDSFKNKLEKYRKKELEKKIMGNGLNKLKSLF